MTLKFRCLSKITSAHYSIVNIKIEYIFYENLKKVDRFKAIYISNLHVALKSFLNVGKFWGFFSINRD